MLRWKPSSSSSQQPTTTSTTRRDWHDDHDNRAVGSHDPTTTSHHNNIPNNKPPEHHRKNQLRVTVTSPSSGLVSPLLSLSSLHPSPNFRSQRISNDLHVVVDEESIFSISPGGQQNKQATGKSMKRYMMKRKGCENDNDHNSDDIILVSTNPNYNHHPRSPTKKNQNHYNLHNNQHHHHPKGIIRSWMMMMMMMIPPRSSRKNYVVLFALLFIITFVSNNVMESFRQASVIHHRRRKKRQADLRIFNGTGNHQRSTEFSASSLVQYYLTDVTAAMNRTLQQSPLLPQLQRHWVNIKVFLPTHCFYWIYTIFLERPYHCLYNYLLLQPFKDSDDVFITNNNNQKYDVNIDDEETVLMSLLLSSNNNSSNHYVIKSNDSISHDNNHKDGTATLEYLIKPHDFIYQRDHDWDSVPIVLEEFKLIFFTTAKVGCTVWKTLFRRMMKYHDWNVTNFSNMIPWNPKYNGLKYLYDYSIPEASRMIQSPDWIKAIFVRDPKERFVSAFLDKAVSNPSYLFYHCCIPSTKPSKYNNWTVPGRHNNNNNTTHNDHFDSIVSAFRQQHPNETAEQKFARQKHALMKYWNPSYLVTSNVSSQHLSSTLANEYNPTYRSIYAQRGIKKESTPKPPPPPKPQPFDECVNRNDIKLAKRQIEVFFHRIVSQCKNSHWKKQSLRMEEKYWPYINFVGHMETITADSEKLLRLIGAWDEYGSNGWGSGSDDDNAGRIFAPKQSMGRKHQTDASQKLKQYIATMEFEMELEEFYINDYRNKVLNLPLKRIFVDADNNSSNNDDHHNTNNNHKSTTAMSQSSISATITSTNPLLLSSIPTYRYGSSTSSSNNTNHDQTVPASKKESTSSNDIGGSNADEMKMITSPENVNSRNNDNNDEEEEQTEDDFSKLMDGNEMAFLYDPDSEAVLLPTMNSNNNNEQDTNNDEAMASITESNQMNQEEDVHDPKVDEIDYVSEEPNVESVIYQESSDTAMDQDIEKLETTNFDWHHNDEQGNEGMAAAAPAADNEELDFTLQMGGREPRDNNDDKTANTNEVDGNISEDSIEIERLELEIDTIDNSSNNDDDDDEGNDSQ